jgi:hypothetical protein
MKGSTILWIVLGVLVLLAIAAAIYFATRKEDDVRPTKATPRRQDATSRTESVRRREVKVRDADVGTRRVDAEPDSTADEARKLRKRAQQEDNTDPDTNRRKN